MDVLPATAPPDPACDVMSLLPMLVAGSQTQVAERNRDFTHRICITSITEKTPIIDLSLHHKDKRWHD